MVHQQPRARVERRLGKLDRADVVLRDAQHDRAFVEEIAEGGTIRLDARRALGELAVDAAVMPEDARKEHLRERLDDARAADAGDAAAPCGLREAGIIGPKIAADHLETRLQAHGIDPHALDGAGRGALPATYLCTLESGPGWTRAGEEAIPVPEYDLGLGAAIDQQRELLRKIRTLGEH